MYESYSSYCSYSTLHVTHVCIIFDFLQLIFIFYCSGTCTCARTAVGFSCLATLIFMSCHVRRYAYITCTCTHVQLDCSLNDLKAVLASSRQMQMADLICYMKLRKKIGLSAFIYFFPLVE
jgi:hypothetical protein